MSFSIIKIPLLFLILFSSCSTLNQMSETVFEASDVVEKNTEKLTEMGLKIEKNTKQVEASGLIIADNTRKIREFTYPMRFAFPIFVIAIFTFNYIFFRLILRKIDKLEKK